MNSKKFIIFIIIVILLVGGVGFAFSKSNPATSGKYDQLAQCIKSSGAEFYGAFWCSHCKDQKADFGSSKKYLPYIECANPDNSQTQVCIDKKIEGYPLWIFADGERISGKMSLESLAEKTQCLLPQ